MLPVMQDTRDALDGDRGGRRARRWGLDGRQAGSEVRGEDVGVAGLKK